MPIQSPVYTTIAFTVSRRVSVGPVKRHCHFSVSHFPVRMSRHAGKRQEQYQQPVQTESAFKAIRKTTNMVVRPSRPPPAANTGTGFGHMAGEFFVLLLWQTGAARH
jgi:hypothetical protein